MTPDLSVIIPAFNAERWIHRCIESVLDQSIKGCEILVINDGSTDNTSNILHTFEGRIQVIHQRNQGVSFARNAGIGAAKGKYIRFLDADDQFPVRSSDGILKMCQSRNNSIIIGKCQIIDTDSAITRNGGYGLEFEFKTGETIPPEFLISQATHCGLLLIPAELARRCGGFNPLIKLGEEYDFCTRLISQGPTVTGYNEVIYSVRDHSGPRLSRSGNELDYIYQAETIERCVREISNHILEIDPDFFVVLSGRCWSLGRHCLRVGYKNAASRYFDLSRRFGGSNAVVLGTRAYKLACQILGPVGTEYTFELLKNVLKK